MCDLQTAAQLPRPGLNLIAMVHHTCFDEQLTSNAFGANASLELHQAGSECSQTPATEAEAWQSALPTACHCMSWGADR